MALSFIPDGEPPRERLFDVMMARFDVLRPHRAAVLLAEEARVVQRGRCASKRFLARPLPNSTKLNANQVANERPHAPTCNHSNTYAGPPRSRISCEWTY